MNGLRFLRMKRFSRPYEFQAHEIRIASGVRSLISSEMIGGSTRMNEASGSESALR